MIYRKIFIYITLFVLFIQTNLVSQESINFERLSISEGLSSESINSIYQDKMGYLWFSTEEGLNRYDGYSLIVYRNEPLDSTSILGNRIFKVYQDKRGDLWVCTDEALNRYDYNTDSFERFFYDEADERQYFNAAIGVCEDHDGVLWVAKAYHGISKLNKKDKKVVQVKIDSTDNSINNFAIISILEDKFDNLWYTIGDNNSNLVKINKDRTQEINFSNLEEKSVPPSNMLSINLSLDKEGLVWLCSRNGYIYKYNEQEDKFEEKIYIPGSSISSLFFDENNILWIATYNMGIIKYNLSDDSYQKFGMEEGNKNSLQTNICIQIYKDRSGVYWVATRNAGLAKFDPNKEPFSLYTLTKDVTDGKAAIYSLSISKDSNKVWAGTGDGIYYLDIESGEILKDNGKVNSNDPLSNNTIRAVLEDSEGNLWYSAWGKGLFKYNKASDVLVHYVNSGADANTIPNNNVRTIYEDREQNIWIGTQAGLAKYNKDGNNFTRYKRFGKTFNDNVLTFVDSILYKKNIAAIEHVRDNQNITKEFTINNDGEYLVIDLGESFLRDSTALWDYGWIEDLAGNVLWKKDSSKSRHGGGADKNQLSIEVINLKKGLYKLRYKSDDSHSYGNWNESSPRWEFAWGIRIYKIDQSTINFLNKNLPEIVEKNSFTSEDVRAIYEDSKGNYWLGSSDNGFTIFNPKKNEYTQFTDDSKDPNRIVHSRVNSFYEDEKGIMWIATFGGLCQYNPESKIMRTFTTSDGLPTAHLIEILRDDNNNFWLSTLRGLIKFEPGYKNQIPTFISYELKDGLQGYEFNTSAKAKTKDGKLFFGGKDGMNGFYPGQINHNPPEVTITELKIMNQPVHPGSENSPLNRHISVTKEITLDYNQNVITFEFVAMHYSRPEKNQYAYILEGFDTDWNMNNRRFATYTNLYPGEYIFKVIAANADGVWNDHGTSISITILPPWWATWWAYASYSLVLIGGFVTLNQTQKNRIKKRERHKAILEQAELRAEAAELQAKAAEAQAKVVQAENERKTKELEEARSLQLAMLPDELPVYGNLDIAVYMQTATEVGGDYYDFSLDEKDTLTVVTGDATGHGLNAGTIVTVTKSLFNTLSGSSNIIDIFKEMSRVIKNMNFRMLTMCLSILKINGNKVRLSSAGMPPVHIYRNQQDIVDELLIRGMPLGIKRDFPYELVETTVESEDIILMMSDGFPELFNPKGEMFGYEKVKDILLEAKNKSASEIIDHFNKVVQEWAQTEEPHDDISFVVIKVK